METNFRTWPSRPVDHRVENMTTRALDRHVGQCADGATMSVIAKTLQPASESTTFAMIPEEHRADTLVAVDWLDEPRVYRSRLAQGLPAPLRMPGVYAIDGDAAVGRITLWLEDVADTTSWDLDRYRRTAEGLGRLGGAWSGRRGIDELGFVRRDIGGLFRSKVINFDLPIQSDDGFWRQPAVAAAIEPGHRRELFELAERMPAMIERLAHLPSGICHGDATPDNFREPGDGHIVVIDWAFAGVDALGSDLAQLLAGRFDNGAADIDDVGSIADVILQGYLTGLAAEGVETDPALVEWAWATHLAIRSVFCALVPDSRPDLTLVEQVALLQRRAALARFGLDLARRATDP